MIEHKIIL